MKPGILTTEFWLALIIVIAGAFASQYAETPAGQIAGVAAGALVAAGYGFARSQVKKFEAASVAVSNSASTMPFGKGKGR
jgi:hypothetical protein